MKYTLIDDCGDAGTMTFDSGEHNEWDLARWWAQGDLIALADTAYALEMGETPTAFALFTLAAELHADRVTDDTLSFLGLRLGEVY